MPQLTLYIDQVTLNQIEGAARLEKTSISKWVKERVTSSINSSWPKGYHELVGSLKNLGLKRPKQQSFRHDARRAKF